MRLQTKERIWRIGKISNVSPLFERNKDFQKQFHTELFLQLLFSSRFSAVSGDVLKN